MKKIIIALALLCHPAHAQDKPIIAMPKSCEPYRDVIPSYWGEGISYEQGTDSTTSEDMTPRFEGRCSDDTISLLLGFGKGCTGASVCRIGTFARQRLVSQNQSIYPQKLFKPFYLDKTPDIMAYFTPATCGANCSDSHLMWIENGYFYEIGNKAADLDTLIKSQQSIKSSSTP
ncbi:MAG: hypothetical protein EAZ74_02650 [Alphaproteobacteria bacterium]|nr:MAG: hypothetical protein EAY76_04840 [Alphaproteobacteria bacterium]TAF15067.1 MAG: hypothetical protein EAZ74_02650 [Alphaproteobacteria bacterium]TAF40473.1 MAG: hypothetical protein EAZ66_03020 [Alphaproteobacteria bacterium]TAF76904.1 MAG: hypothetical protein EAZ52_01940 [Alphaproteobacteria bacterium]